MFADLTDQRFGKLLVLRYEGKKGSAHCWLCRCDCGTETIATTSHLRNSANIACGCNRGKHRTRPQRRPYGESAFNALYYNYVSNAAVRGIEFNLGESLFRRLVTDRCFYCGAPPTQTMQRKRMNGSFTYNGIDRVDNARGYMADNCVTCCKRCNHSKKDMTAEDFLEWVYQVYKHSIEPTA